MFGFALKERTAEVLRRATTALVTNNFIDRSAADDTFLGEEATAALYFECHAQCLVALHMLLRTSVAGDKSWANLEFFTTNVKIALRQSDYKSGLPEGTSEKYILPRFLNIGHAIYEDRANDPFICSVVYLIEQDLASNLEPDGTSSSIANDELIRAVLVASTEAFHAAASQMFTRSR